MVTPRSTSRTARMNMGQIEFDPFGLYESEQPPRWASLRVT